MGQSISHVEACELLKRELNIEKPYSVREGSENESSTQRVICLVHQDWLATQISSKKDVTPHKHTAKSLSIEEQISLLQPSHESKSNGWHRINAIIIKKPLIKLLRRHPETCDFESSSLSDFLHEVLKEHEVNMVNDFCKQFNKSNEANRKDAEYLNEESFKEIIDKTYDIKVKKLINDFQSLPSSSLGQLKYPLTALESGKSTTMLHFAPVLLAIESDSCFYIFENTPQYTLYDILAFSPAIVANSAAKFLFILYQILRCFSSFLSMGFRPHPWLTFNDIYITNSIWLSVSGFDIDTREVAVQEADSLKPLIANWTSDVPPILTQLFTCEHSLQHYTTMWVNNELTNFDYVMILNTLTQRRMKDPSHYPIFPWIMDFTKPSGGWRDLSKSKFRLCKSDAQLDITFRHVATKQSRRDAVAHVAHHISDHPLTIISYYVYLARRTPKHVLCKNVRSRWVPDEYPSSMERLFQWTPEECIPEFYSDPGIFKSIHPDLPDLQLPDWADSPEDFIAKHRNALEGSHVSQNLNDWIDIMFGYKLFGTASVEAKNVYLSVVDGHCHSENADSAGIGNANKLDSRNAADANKQCEVFSEDISCVAGKLLEDDVKVHQPVAIRRDLWSIESAIDETGQAAPSVDTNETEPHQRPSFPAAIKHRFDSLLEGASEAKTVPPFEEIKINMEGPLAAMDELENLEKKLKFDVQLGPPHKHGIGKHEFASVFESSDNIAKSKVEDSLEPMSSCSSDMKLLACLVIELVLHDHSRLRTKRLELDERLRENVRLLAANRYRFPSWLVALLNGILNMPDAAKELTKKRESFDDDDDDMIKHMRTSSMLLNQCMNPLSMPSYFPALHNTLIALYSVDNTRNALSCSINRSSFLLLRIHDSVSPDNIIRASQLLPGLLENLDYEGIDLLLTFLLPLFARQDTKLAAFLNMFHALGSVLGHHKSLTVFYPDLQKLYDSSNKSDPEEWKLLEQGFISKVITVFGLSCFLDRFIPFVIDGLVEDVENSKSKEKEDSIEDGIENEFLGDHNEAESQDTYGLKKQKTGSGTFESFLEEDEGGMSLFDNEILLDERKRSGVFSRLESIVEDEHSPRKGIFVEVIEEIDEIVVDSDGQAGWREAHGSGKHSIETHTETDCNTASLSFPEPGNEAGGDDVSNNKPHCDEVTVGGIENGLSTDNKARSVSDPLSRFAVIDHNTSANMTDSKRGEKNSADDDGINDNSLDSVGGPDDNFQSFLIRRSAIRSKKRGDQSPFMIVSSDDEASGDSTEEMTHLVINKVPDSNVLEGIDKISSCSSSKSFMLDLSAQDMCLSSLRWIIPWLGPVVTTRYVVNAVLKKLPRVWLNVRNTEVTYDLLMETLANKRKYLMECIIDIIRVYGNSFVLHQFIPYAVHAVELATTSPTVSPFVEGQLVTAVEILLKTLPFLTFDDLTTQIEVLSHEIFEPLLRLLSSLKKFSTGAQVRSVLLRALVDVLADLSKNLGQIDAREVVTPLLQRFFSCFDCIYRLDKKSGNSCIVFRKFSFIDDYNDDDMKNDAEEDDENCDEKEFPINLQSTHVNNDTNLTNPAENPAESSTEKKRLSYAGGESTNDSNSESTRREGESNAYKDLYESFKPSLAYYSYVLFCRVLGGQFIGSILYNEELIWQLCSNYDEGLTLASNQDIQMNEAVTKTAENQQATPLAQDDQDVDRSPSVGKKPKRLRTVSEHEDMEPVYRSTWQHLEGEWFHHWKQSIESKYEDGKLVFDGRRLQTYAGHLSTVRDIYVPDNEHYFLSASRDKTVKLWLLKNHGNGTAQLGCSKTYDKHTKSVFAIQAIESKRLVVSCDGSVHLWDPIKMSLVNQVELNKNSSVLSLRTLPVPHTTVAMATTEGTIKMYDVRQKRISQEWKLISSSAAGIVKCLCVNESGTWIAAGFSSGFISVLDLRTGILRAQWRAHESEILHIESYHDHNFLSSSADLRMKMWNEDGSLALRFRSPAEPIPYLFMLKDQCVWATATGNKIGITNTVENWASYTTKKLSADVFKGTVSKLTVLPVNQMYLIGSEDGSVTLFD
eukprot:gene20325-22324_t